MSLFKQKKVSCKTCSKKFPEKKAWKVNMKTAEGQMVIRICPECADVLNLVRETLDSQVDE